MKPVTFDHHGAQSCAKVQELVEAAINWHFAHHDLDPDVRIILEKMTFCPVRKSTPVNGDPTNLIVQGTILSLPPATYPNLIPMILASVEVPATVTASYRSGTIHNSAYADIHMTIPEGARSHVTDSIAELIRCFVKQSTTPNRYPYGDVDAALIRETLATSGAFDNGGFIEYAHDCLSFLSRKLGVSASMRNSLRALEDDLNVIECPDAHNISLTTLSGKVYAHVKFRLGKLTLTTGQIHIGDVDGEHVAMKPHFWNLILFHMVQPIIDPSSLQVKNEIT